MSSGLGVAAETGQNQHWSPVVGPGATAHSIQSIRILHFYSFINTVHL